jgi:hypothetical protein
MLNNKEEMVKLKEEKGESVIPKGCYCYSNIRMTKGKTKEGLPILKTDNCPYWDSNSEASAQMYGYCWFLGKGDWEEDGTFLLFDQCKECGVNYE